MESVTEIRIEYRDHETAIAIHESVNPDNVGAPPGIDISMKVTGNTLEIKVTSEKSIKGLISTLDDLLDCIQAGERALEQF